MSIFTWFQKRETAPVARERLQILLAHERAVSTGQDLVAILQEEILAVIGKHVQLEREKVQIKVDRGGDISTLEIGVEMPSPPLLAKAS